MFCDLQKRGYICAGIGAVGWGISGVCGQYLFMEYDISSSWLTAVRMLFSGIILLLFAIHKNRQLSFSIWKCKKDVAWLTAFSIFGLLMCQYTFMSAVKFSNSPTATVLQSLNVIIMAVVMSIWTKKPMHMSQFAAVFLAVFGTFLIATGGNIGSIKISGAGLIFGLLTAVGVVTYTLLSKPITHKYGNIVITGWGMLLGGFVIFIVSKAWIIPENLDLMAYFMLFMVVVIGTAFSFVMFLEGVQCAGSMKATLIGCSEPVAATILSVIFLHTTFSYIEILGFICIIVTVVLSVKEKN